MVNSKINFIFLFVFIAVICILSGCKSTGNYTEQSILEHQARVIELENRNRAFAERIGQYDQLTERTIARLETIRNRAAGIADTADRIDYLFTEYERAIQQFIYELREIGREVKDAQSDFNVGGYPVSD